MPGVTKRENQMAKKYLDTKQSTIEASVLDVWTKSSEEQEAIRNAAEMMVQQEQIYARKPPRHTSSHTCITDAGGCVKK